MIFHIKNHYTKCCPMDNQRRLYTSLLNSRGYLSLEKLKEHLETDEKLEIGTLRAALLENSGLRLTKKDLIDLKFADTSNPLDNIIYAQELAKSKSSNIYIACMPKSGSSFLARALQEGLNALFSLTTTSRMRFASAFGINGREQEICELALIKKILVSYFL